MNLILYNKHFRRFVFSNSFKNYYVLLFEYFAGVFSLVEQYYFSIRSVPFLHFGLNLPNYFLVKAVGVVSIVFPYQSKGKRFHKT